MLVACGPCLIRLFRPILCTGKALPPKLPDRPQNVSPMPGHVLVVCSPSPVPTGPVVIADKMLGAAMYELVCVGHFNASETFPQQQSCPQSSRARSRARRQARSRVRSRAGNGAVRSCAQPNFFRARSHSPAHTGHTRP